MLKFYIHVQILSTICPYMNVLHELFLLELNLYLQVLGNKDGKQWAYHTEEIGNEGTLQNLFY